VNKALLLITVASIALIGGIGARNLIAPSKAEANPAATLPNFSLPDLSGKQRSIDEWKNKVKVINFWATWCHPCLKEMPEFDKFYQEHSAKGLQVIGIALDDPEPVQEFIDKYKISYPILVSPDEGIKIAHSLGNIVNTVPFTVVADKKGVIVKTHMGTLTADELIKITGPLLQD
jgi:thiol-disulfide isomerase/thioredoxin